MSDPLVEFEGVSMSYGHEPVLREVSFALAAGDHLALLGASGCGKSTVFALLAGLIPPISGRIRVAGEVVSDAGDLIVPPHRRGLAMVFQDLALWPNLTAFHNVIMGIPHDAVLDRAARKSRAKEVLSLCGIAGFATRKPGALSGGQQQRVALARALAAQPRLLLLDEPFTGLDLVLKQQLVEEIRALAEKFEITMMVVSHDPWEVSSLCRRALVLENHGVIEEGALADLLRHPVSRTMKAMAARYAE